MKNRFALLKPAGWLAALLMVVSAPAQAEKTYRLTLAETWTTNSPILSETSRHMAEMAEKMSAGRLQIRVDASNKHKAPFGIFDMVKAGQYDMATRPPTTTRARSRTPCTSPRCPSA